MFNHIVCACFQTEWCDRRTERLRSDCVEFPRCFVLLSNYWWASICPPWLRLTCLWVILTMTEGGEVVDVRRISQTLSRWWMERFFAPPAAAAAVPVLQPRWMKNDTLVSHCLMNIKCQVCDIFVCACAHAGTRQKTGKKLFVLIWVSHFIVPTHVSNGTHTV